MKISFPPTLATIIRLFVLILTSHQRNAQLKPQYCYILTKVATEKNVEQLDLTYIADGSINL